MRADILLVITGMAAVTFATRFACLLIFNRTGVPTWLEKWLKHVPTAILTALIVPSILMPQGTLDLSPDNHYLLAGLVAALIALKTENVIATMATGLAVMLFLRLFFNPFS